MLCETIRAALALAAGIPSFHWGEDDASPSGKDHQPIHNLAAKQPERVERMLARLREIVANVPNHLFVTRSGMLVRLSLQQQVRH